MIKEVNITNYLGDSVTYKIDGVNVENNNGLIITDIEGLGPAKANLNFTKLATYDGQIYNSAILDGRNIIIHAKFTWARTIEEARLATYKFFPIKKQVQFVITTDKRVATTWGYVESNAPEIFSDTDEVPGMTISIMCESSTFLDARGENLQMFSDVEPMFEFVYQNLSMSPVTEMSTFESRKICHINYEGDSESGFKMIIHAIGTVRNLTIFNVRTGEHINIDTNKLSAKTGSGLIEGDDIIIVSKPGEKSAKLLRNGDYTNILNVLGKDPVWFSLAQGDNRFAYMADYGEENVRISIEVQPLYDGV